MPETYPDDDHEFTAAHLGRLLAVEQSRNRELRAALDKVMIGGNHVALLIGAFHPPYTASHDEALKHYGAGDQYEAWCCWRTIMEARDVLEPSI